MALSMLSSSQFPIYPAAVEANCLAGYPGTHHSCLLNIPRLPKFKDYNGKWSGFGLPGNGPWWFIVPGQDLFRDILPGMNCCG